MDLLEYLSDPSRKQAYVTTLFDVVAPGYDAFTKLFSFGMDFFWKRRLVHEAWVLCPQSGVVLDLACGTGDLAEQMGARFCARLLAGLDASRMMLREAKARAAPRPARIRLVAANLMDLPVRTSSIDVVTMGYGLRNTPSAARGLAEVARVLRSGGAFVNLDFYRPASPVWRKVFLRYMWYAGRAAGWLWHREPATYGYLAPSIRQHLTISEFNKALSDAGFSVERLFPHLGGAICIHVATTRR